MRRAIVIRYGDPELAEAIANGMELAEQPANAAPGESAENIQRMQKAEAALVMRMMRDEAFYREKIAEAEANYGWIHPSRNPVTNFLWGVYGLLIEKTCDALDYFMAEMARG